MKEDFNSVFNHYTIPHCCDKQRKQVHQEVQQTKKANQPSDPGALFTQQLSRSQWVSSHSQRNNGSARMGSSQGLRLLTRSVYETNVQRTRQRLGYFQYILPLYFYLFSLMFVWLLFTELMLLITVAQLIQFHSNLLLMFTTQQTIPLPFTLPYFFIRLFSVYSNHEDNFCLSQWPPCQVRQP